MPYDRGSTITSVLDGSCFNRFQSGRIVQTHFCPHSGAQANDLWNYTASGAIVSAIGGCLSVGPAESPDSGGPPGPSPPPPPPPPPAPQPTACPKAGACDWASFHPRARADLTFLLDNGWERDTFQLNTAALYPDEAAPSNAQALAKLSERVAGRGWVGLGFWVNTAGDTADWAAHFRDAGAANLTYLKIDGGDHPCSATALAKELAPLMAVEHSIGNGPLGDDPYTAAVPIINRSDTYRTYDVTPELSIPTTLERTAGLLAAFDKALEDGAVAPLPYPLPSSPRPERRVIIAQDEVHLAAALSLAAGVMRHPMHGVCNTTGGGHDTDDQLSGPRDLKHRMDEVARMTRWHRIAPPMGLGTRWPALRTRVDPRKLTDTWTFRPGDTWDHALIGKTVQQAAPARVSRGVPLPTVTPARAGASACGEVDGAVPYVVASQHANGALAIGTLGRYNDTLGYCTPRADVVLEWPTQAASGSSGVLAPATPPTPPAPRQQVVGVFGHYGSLTLSLPPLWNVTVTHVIAQDLLARVRLVTQKASVDDCLDSVSPSTRVEGPPWGCIVRADEQTRSNWQPLMCC